MMTQNADYECVPNLHDYPDVVDVVEDFALLEDVGIAAVHVRFLEPLALLTLLTPAQIDRSESNDG